MSMVVDLLWKYIKYDIDQWTYRLGDTRKEDPEQRHIAQTDDSELDNLFIWRNVEEALSTVKLFLEGRLERIAESGDNVLDTDERNWTIVLKEHSRSGDAKVLADLIHKYVVNYVLNAWSANYYPDMVAQLQGEMQSLVAGIDEAAHALRAPMKHKRKKEKDIDDMTVEEEDI